MTYFIFNDRFSANVGDGLLSECLEWGLRRSMPDRTIRTIDIDGKTDYPHESSNKKINRLQNIIPRRLRRTVKDYLNLFRMQARLEKAIAQNGDSAQAFIIGGGHLITATSTYFPTRIHALSAIARREGIKFYIQSVGVSNPVEWKKTGRKFLQTVLDGNPDLSYVSVRDELSASYWGQAFSNSPPLHIVRDPGLLAIDVYGQKKNQDSATLRIGIGVIDDDTVRKLGSETVSRRMTKKDYIRMGKLIYERNCVPVYFTNGDFEDQELVERIQRDIFLGKEFSAEFAPRPESPVQLYEIIAGLNGVIAHRMHANVVAYSLMIPSIGLGWDIKLQSFFESIECTDRFISQNSFTPEHAVAAVFDAIENGIDEGQHQAVLLEALAGIGRLASALTAQN